MRAIRRTDAALALAIAVLAWNSAKAAAAGKCELVDLTPGTAIDYAKVKPDTAKLYFVKGAEAKGCPSTAESCRARPFVLAGDPVMIARAPGDFVCAEFVSPKGAVTAGFLPAAALMPAPPPELPLERWLGKWRTGDHQAIEIKRGTAAGELVVSGHATYGEDDPVRVKNGAVNEGDFEAIAKPRGWLIEIAADETAQDAHTKPFDTPDDTLCKLRIEFEGDALFAQDNGTCGGMNVTFDGSYKRR